MLTVPELSVAVGSAQFALILTASLIEWTVTLTGSGQLANTGLTLSGLVDQQHRLNSGIKIHNSAVAQRDDEQSSWSNFSLYTFNLITIGCHMFYKIN